MVGCTITGRINRKQTAVDIRHSTARQREYVEEQQEQQSSNQGYVEHTKADGSTTIYIPNDGFSDPTIAIQQVVVRAPLRAITERNGKVSIDFVLTLPKELMGNCRGVEVTPMLYRSGKLVPMESLSIRGALFDKVQERNYWQYEQYLTRFKPDPTRRDWAYERFVRYPYPEGTRMDSVVTTRTGHTYYYKQDVPTAETEGDAMLVTLRGRVVALDKSVYEFPLSDTLEFNISSMLSFVDLNPRFVTRVIEKYAVVNDRNYLKFAVNSSNIVDTLSDNSKQLAFIDRRMDEILNQREFYIDSIILTATSSPEGGVGRNVQLARDRALALRDRLIRKFPRARLDQMLTVRWVAEDWNELERLVAADNRIRHQRQILEMIRYTPDRDLLEYNIRSRYPDDYRYMFERLYPMLRAVNFKYDLRRVGMIKDTVYTTVIDTMYARGVMLLQSRRYEAALKVLGGFRDRNAALCMMSMGRDRSAYETLMALPEHSAHRYLLAILSARLGRTQEAMMHFDRACELNSVLRFRGRLDPELSRLIKAREDGDQS